MILELPQGQFFIDAEPSTLVILVAGGRPPDANWLKQVVQNFPVWAIDRGIDVCRSAAVIPEILIGDADSGAAASWQWGEDLGLPVLKHPADKDLTDLQLTLQELGRRRPGAMALLTGGMGGRFDHAYSNMFSLLESVAWGVQPIGTADEAEAVFFVGGGQTLQAELRDLPVAVSLLPFSSVCENVHIQGVHWPLQGEVLTLNHPGGICNRLAAGARNVSTSLGRGLMGAYFCWKESGL